MAGLAPTDVERLYAAARAIRDHQPDTAQRLLTAVLDHTPWHPEAIRLRSILELQTGQPRRAAASLQHALQRAPRNAALRSQLGTVYSACGQRPLAIEQWRAALALDPALGPTWFNLGRALQADGDSAAAADALQRAHALLPTATPAAVLLGDALLHLGRLDEARHAYRDALAVDAGCGDAWRGLANIKTVPLDAADAHTMQAQLARRDLPEPDRIAINHALGKLEEDRGNYATAFDCHVRANRLQHARHSWSRQALQGFVDKALAVSATLPAPLDPQLGHEVIFIVGMPRSGSTLVEQILAAHPHVAGASELPELGLVIQAESARRHQPYPDWIGAANAADWHRLGQEYLAHTARWRRERPRHTDKMPENWKHAGILRAMLPGATVIETRRDALETAWSCFKQPFYQQPHFANAFDNLGFYLRCCEQTMAAWRQRDPAHSHLFQYESLLREPEPAIRQLLQWAGLAFDSACLQPHRASRSVRSASAAQVRQPLQANTRRADAYGPLLDPLRAALDLPSFAAA